MYTSEQTDVKGHEEKRNPDLTGLLPRGSEPAQLFAPYVRLELLGWAPLFSSVGLDSMAWYALLFDYGMPAGGDAVRSRFSTTSVTLDA